MTENLSALDLRYEEDSLGRIAVPAAAPWGAVTERARRHFQIGEGSMPTAIIHALAWIKEAAAAANLSYGLIDSGQQQAIAAVCRRIRTGELDHAFPLPVWQTGSGTQTNMNVNEVISRLAAQAELAEDPTADPARFHANDVVNRSQSSNDVFPAALRIAAVLAVRERLRPALGTLLAALERLSAAHGSVVKLGRTHLMDATPIRFEQEIAAWTQALRDDEAALDALTPACLELPLGGTAVGSGLNSPAGFGERAAAWLARETGLPFTAAPVPGRHMASQTALVNLHGPLAALAADLFKLAADIRLLGSGPRGGIGELLLPANEPGSSIMPGKVNPTQSEMLIMVAIQVMANGQAITLASSQGQLQLNVCLPLIGSRLLESIRLLADAMTAFAEFGINGLELNHRTIQAHVESSLMQVTALTAAIGYREAARLAQEAAASGGSLREAVLASGLLSAADYDRLTAAERMTRPDPVPGGDL
ncbi:MAG: class II fumarate hydratase [Bacillota bacterium]|nr:class II fumarate hydratase [Bacillota bacterium]